MVSRSLWPRLSDAAKKKGFEYANFLCYEEDCRYAVALLELPETWAVARVTEKSLLETISSWDADYLIERGIAPTEPQYSRYLAYRKEDEMRENKHPDLIVSATGDWDHPDKPGTVRVETADGVTHWVTSASYETAGRLINLLSLCEEVTS